MSTPSITFDDTTNNALVITTTGGTSNNLMIADSDNGNAAIKITNVLTCTADNDVANKAYVDSVASGLSVRESVRVGTTVAVTLASSF